MSSENDTQWTPGTAIRWRKDAPWLTVPDGLRGHAAKPPTPTIDDLVSVFNRHLYLPDPQPVHVLASTIAANMLDGDPLWLMVVAPSSWAKTELISPFVSVKHCHLLDDVSQAGLIAGGVRKRDGTSTGGKLLGFGKLNGQTFGILVVKDLSSVLAELNRKDSKVMGALRRVYDGEYSRDTGTDGGKSFYWSGKAGLIAAVTEDVDLAMATIDRMGSRFVYYRLPDQVDRDQVSRIIHRRAGGGTAMRAELAAAAKAFFVLRPPAEHQVAIDAETADRLTTLAGFASAARSVVYRDQQRVIEAVPRLEGTGRLYGELEQLYKGGLAIGLADPWPMVRKVALDSMVRLRWRVLKEVAQRNRPSTANVADNLNLPEATVRQHLEDLNAHHVLNRSGDTWELSPWARSRWRFVSDSPVTAAVGTRTGEAPPTATTAAERLLADAFGGAE